MATQFPEQYRRGLRLFNEEDFFECHEIIEELWSETLGEPKKFLQGLIQAAVALFHFGNENFGGAKKLYLSARDKLTPFGDEYMGIALGRFLNDFVDTTCLTISLPATRCVPFLKQLYPDCRTPSLWRILKNADLPQANRLDRPFPSCFGVN